MKLPCFDEMLAQATTEIILYQDEFVSLSLARNWSRLHHLHLFLSQFRCRIGVQTRKHHDSVHRRCSSHALESMIVGSQKIGTLPPTKTKVFMSKDFERDIADFQNPSKQHAQICTASCRSVKFNAAKNFM